MKRNENEIVYELWEHECGHLYIGRDCTDAEYRQKVETLMREAPDAQLTWTTKASSFNEAMQALYDRNGWGHYRTLEEELGETEVAD